MGSQLCLDIHKIRYNVKLEAEGHNIEIQQISGYSDCDLNIQFYCKFQLSTFSFERGKFGDYTI